MSEDTLRETFCKNLSRILKERKMTQRDFAKAVGVSAATANEWLKGKKMPLMGRIDTICSVLSIDRSDLMATPAPAAEPMGLTARDERDIERRLDAIMNDLAPGTGLAFYDGQKLTDSERDLLRISLKNSMELVRSMAKERFTPKKYKK